MRACSGLYTAEKRNQGFRSFLHRLVPSSRAGNMRKRGPGEEGRAAPPHGEKRKAHGLFKTLFHLPSRVRKNNPDTAPPVARRRRPPCRAFSSGDRFLHRCSSGNSRRFRREVHRCIIALWGNGSGGSGAGRLSVFISDTGIFLRSAPGRELGAVSVFLGGGGKQRCRRASGCVHGRACCRRRRNRGFRIFPHNFVQSSGAGSGSTQKSQVCGPAAGFAAASLRAHSTVHRPFRQGSLPE